VSYIGNAPISAAFLTDTFSGTGSQVAYTMTVAPANTSSIIVAVTGVLQDPSTYAVSGTTLTFSAAPPSGTSNISVRYLGIPASGVTTTAYRTVTDFTATAGQTSFSVPSYTVGYIDVYRNGVRLVSTDFVATTGTTVVLNNACTVGDAVVTESFLVSSVLNAIQQYNGSSTNQALTTPTLTSPIITGSTPQVTVYTSGSGTYTTPANTRYLIVEMVGGGGGGAGGGTGSWGAGGTGGNTTFGSNTANGGTGASIPYSNGGNGGSFTIGTGTGYGIVGGSAGDGSLTTTGSTVTNAVGSAGGGTPFSSGGGGGAYVVAGRAGSTNSGAGGGGGAGGNGASTNYGGNGGGGAGYINATITSPAATYSYAVGAAGTAGAAGTGTNPSAGGAGGSGLISITAYF